MFTIQLRPD